MLTSVDSYYVVFYNKNHERILAISWKKTFLERFANRVSEAALKEEAESLKEPWFSIIPNRDPEKKMERAPVPKGLTSVSGGQFIPDPNLDLTPHSKPSITFFTLKIYDIDKELFSGEYSMEDIFRGGSEHIFKKLLTSGRIERKDGPFYYEVTTQKLISTTKITIVTDSNLFPPQARQGHNVFELPKREENRTKITFNKVKIEPLEVYDTDKFQETEVLGKRGKPGLGKVLLRRAVYKELVQGLELSSTAEDGGYLIGHAYRLPESPIDENDKDFRWAIEITDVIKAQGAYGNAGALLFTHNTWSELKNKIDQDFPDKKLLSWFHTHLFKATDSFGLSGMDQELHRQFFTKPWQVALLLNIDVYGDRELRCFQRAISDNILVESTYEVLK